MNISHHAIRDCTPNSATPAVQTPANPSQIQISSQARYKLLAKGWRSQQSKSKSKSTDSLPQTIGHCNCFYNIISWQGKAHVLAGIHALSRDLILTLALAECAHIMNHKKSAAGDMYNGVCKLYKVSMQQCHFTRPHLLATTWDIRIYMYRSTSSSLSLGLWCGSCLSGGHWHLVWHRWLTLGRNADPLSQAIRLVGWPKLAIFFFFLLQNMEDCDKDAAATRTFSKGHALQLSFKSLFSDATLTSSRSSLLYNKWQSRCCQANFNHGSTLPCYTSL